MTSRATTFNWTGFGVSIGAGLGLVAGLLTAGGAGIALGLACGSAVGVALGAVADRMKRAERSSHSRMR